jgi:hypothetical protein
MDDWFFLQDLAEGAKRLWDVSDDPDATPEDFSKAFLLASNALRRARSDSRVLATLESLEKKTDVEAARKIAASIERFAQFFTLEQELLIRNGLPIRLVVALRDEMEALRRGVLEEKLSAKGVYDKLGEIIQMLEPAIPMTKGAELDRQLALRGSQVLVGVATMKINLLFLPVDLLTATPGLASGITSIMMGSFIAGDGVKSEKPILAKIKRLIPRWKDRG